MLEELRKKSNTQKQAYAFWGAGLATGIVALIWIVSLPARLDDNQIGEVEGGTQAAGAISQFFQEMKSNISETWEDSQDALEGISASTSTSAGISTATSTATTTKTTPVLIATSSPKEAKIATSTAPNR